MNPGPSFKLVHSMIPDKHTEQIIVILMSKKTLCSAEGWPGGLVAQLEKS